jgi:ABC-2 type transport system ATP-binding protein
MNEALAIDIKGLSKTFEKVCAVCEVDFQIKEGEIFGFLGPNGSGKTTSMRMICGLLKPDAGVGHCLGYDIIKDSIQIKKHVGYMTQDFSLYDDLTAYENLEFIARLYQMKNYHEMIHDTFQKLKFSQTDQNKLASKLSGGWKQRLSLASAMVHQPQLLLLDEPTSGIDPQARREFWDIVHELAEQGITSLVSTHYLDEAEHCNRLTYIVNGYILTTGTVSEIIDHADLSMWVITGKDLTTLSRRLSEIKGVNQATIFGEKLHVLGKETHLLEEAIAPYRTEQYRFERQRPTLEDVFIYLVSTAKRKL